MNEISINRLETHDRLLDFKKKNVDSISQQIHKMVMERPFEDEPFYIFAHKKTVDMHDQLLYIQAGYPVDKIPTHRLVWQPRLQKPKAETNTMLFKVDPAYPDQVKVIWILPDPSQWEAYKKGQMCQDPTVIESIHDYENDKAALEAPEPDDLTDERARVIYQRLYPKLWERLFANNS
jgi:hypothetical protein